ncbi:hypothetical protein ACFZAM_31485 [Streptomyces sp. NPDC008079]|uniref:hypothetical protein n=1 Tax=Streptomyces sp. NPDC008079 TaxID=3364806 RepID=UPI0036E9905F
MAAAKGLAKLNAELTKTYGERHTRRDLMVPPKFISTGSITLDYALGGGWALGRTHEIVGPEGQCKTSLTILTMAAAQRMYPDRGVAVIDMEQSFDFGWAASLGLDLDPDRFVHLYPDHSEDVADQVKMLLRGGDISVVTVDSIGGMESKAAFDKKADESAMGKNAQVISRMVKQVAKLTRETQSVVLMVNQYRADIGNPRGGQKSAGPSALKYSTTTKVAMRRTGEPSRKVILGDSVSETVKELEVGRQIRAKVERNKLAPQGRAADFWFYNVAQPDQGLGIDWADEAVNLGIATGAIRRLNAASYELPDGAKVVGRAKVKAACLANPDLAAMVRQRALDSIAGDVMDQRVVSYDDIPDGVDPVTGLITED